MGEKFPERKQIRWRNYDYSQAGAYFITICTRNRQNFLSVIPESEDCIPECGSLRDDEKRNPCQQMMPVLQLTEFGTVADNWIRRLPEQYPEISVDSYVIMPNHIHLLMTLHNDSPSAENGTIAADRAMGWLKYRITCEINRIRGKRGEKIFQRSFYDHVVRSREEYCLIERYIHENPMNWKSDRLYVR